MRMSLGSAREAASLLITLVLAFLLHPSGLRAEDFGKVEPGAGKNAQIHPTARSEAEKKVSPEEAFRKALGSLRGHANLLDTKGSIVIQRKQEGGWSIYLKKYADLPPGGLLITVSDDGGVDLKRAEGGGSGAEWMGPGKGEKDHTGRKIRPEVAFRKALEALTKWHIHPDTLYGSGGKITFSRGQAEEWWFVEVSGYSGMRMGGYWITVQDDGSVKVVPGI